MNGGGHHTDGFVHHELSIRSESTAGVYRLFAMNRGSGWLTRLAG
jgi:hypothetical protein